MLRDFKKAKERDWKGIWIPREIWLAEDLSTMEKFLWAEITSLDNERGCHASNAYLADFCGLSVGRIETLIRSLKDKRYIWREHFDGRNRVLRSSLKVLPKRRIREGVEVMKVKPYKAAQPMKARPYNQ